MKSTSGSIFRLVLAFTLIATASTSFSIRSYAKTDQMQIALLGDSRSVGVFSTTIRGEKITLWEKLNIEFMGLILRSIQGRNIRESENPLQELIDLQHEMYNRNFNLSASDTNAFTSDMQYSLKNRIEKLTGKRVLGINSSFESAFTVHAEFLIDKAIEKAPEADPIDIWVIDLGAVDFLAPIDTDISAEYLLRAVNKIKTHNPDAKILLVKVPDFRRMMTFGDRLAYKFIKGESCKSVWNRIGVGKSVYSRFEEAPYELTAKKEAMDEAWDSIREAFPDGSVQTIAYPALLDDLKGMAMDCFHPNYLFFKRLAEDSWGIVRKWVQ